MVHNILWTGGWDSTFRVLELTLMKKQKVQPYYILDSGRPSTPKEMETMEKIKALIEEKSPEARELIHDHIMIEIDRIPNNKFITNSYRTLLAQSHLGSQYDWLARYAKDKGLDDLELCIHRDDKAEGFIKEDVEWIKTENDRYFKLKEHPSLPELHIFSPYKFPLLNMTKLEMGMVAKENGFDDIMEETWFCFYPKKDGTPCGYCNPCKYTKEEGLGRRVPEVSFLTRARLLVSSMKQNVAKLLPLPKRI